MPSEILAKRTPNGKVEVSIAIEEFNDDETLDQTVTLLRETADWLELTKGLSEEQITGLVNGRVN